MLTAARQTASDSATDALGTQAANVAMRAAALYIRQHSLTVDIDALISALRRHCAATLPVALADAKQAIDCGMSAAAEATFKASFANAGIAAAKEVTAAS